MATTATTPAALAAITCMLAAGHGGVHYKQLRQPRSGWPRGKKKAMSKVKGNPTGQCGAVSGYLGVVNY
jgi:hypothetical protein